MAWSIFSSGTSPKSWAESLLHAIGAPSTNANVQSVIAWEVLEGGGGTNNPLNTTFSMPGATNFNSVGVKNYSSLGEGLTATADTLRGSAYAQIVAALKSGHGLGSGHFGGLSTWSGGGYSSVAGGWNRAAAYMSGKGGIIHGVGPGAATPSGGGSGSGSGAGGGGVNTAQLTSFLSSPSGVLSDAGALLHGSAVLIDRVFGLFAPGQGWRIVFGATAAASGYGSYRAFHAGGDDGDGNLPLAIALAGVAAVALFMMARPWPQTAAGPIKPGAYVVDVLEGQPPPAGPAAFSPTEVHLTEAGLAAMLALWAAGKTGQALGGIAAGAGVAGGILGKVWGWIKGLGGEAGAGAGGADIPAPPVEIPPVVV